MVLCGGIKITIQGWKRTAVRDEMEGRESVRSNWPCFMGGSDDSNERGQFFEKDLQQANQVWEWLNYKKSDIIIGCSEPVIEDTVHLSLNFY